MIFAFGREPGVSQLPEQATRGSDHVLNIAYNLLCGGQVLDDIEVRRNDVAFLDALGTRAIPDPTTAGDFCRRFDAEAVERLMGILNEAR
jgi:hypothetical protein